MTAPIIVMIATVLCGALSSIIDALNERKLQKAEKRTKRMAEKCDEIAQLIQEIDDTNGALADGLLNLSASFGVSCEDITQNRRNRMVVRQAEKRNKVFFCGLSADQKPTDVCDGSVFLDVDTGNTYSFDASRAIWSELATKKQETAARDDTRLIPRMCPNCGAPVRGTECEYCGTVFSKHEINMILHGIGNEGTYEL